MNAADVIAVTAVAVIVGGAWLRWGIGPIMIAYKLGYRFAEWQLSRKDRSP